MRVFWLRKIRKYCIKIDALVILTVSAQRSFATTISFVMAEVSCLITSLGRPRVLSCAAALMTAHIARESARDKEITKSSIPAHRTILNRVYHLSATTKVARLVKVIVGASACHPIFSAPKCAFSGPFGRVM